MTDITQVAKIVPPIIHEIEQNALNMKRPTEAELKTQLNQMGMATGDAKKATEDILKAIEKIAFKPDTP